MLHQEFKPPEELKDTIRCFWYNHEDFGEQQSAFEILPDGYAEIIFYFGGPCSIYSDGVMQSLPSPFIMGLLNKPVHLFAQNKLEIIAIRCFPWTVFEVLGLPAGKAGVNTFEHPVSKLQPILAAKVQAGKIDDAIEIVKQYFLDARSHLAQNGLLNKAGIAMRKAKGNLSVSQVAASAHATVRTLERKFKQSSGHTVKDVSGLMRFEQVRNQLWMNPDVNLAGLAHDMGYTDQAHLSKEFKRYSGTTPAAFARKARKEKRVITGDFVAFLQS
ncbi:AraC family transcriptional regulator [Chitinophaga silvatica]|uniref:AraC family transcriptional regulator n=1 Tax=Chitinophaga silvatica TaxID=2282649 RepID=A0A3E1Y5W3_9BACT|nr:helix-turn-helix domain-containing protein [Chitinophaga silvatica]RFS20126.1 AraC family transcriptional regulator [Chitinophaga silvatica]